MADCQEYVVRRRYNSRGDCDFLMSWDVVWGPVWVGSRALAIRFADGSAARWAAEAARACMRPQPWIVPDFGSSSVVHVSWADAPARGA